MLTTLIGILIAGYAFVELFALSANAEIDRYTDQDLRSFPLGAAVHIYKGAFVGVDPGGHLKAFVPGDVFVGVAYEEIDNSSGTAGALNCRVFTRGDFSVTLSGAANEDAGKPLFATADNATALTGHPDGYMGRIVQYLAADEVLLRIKAPGEVAPNGVGSVELKLIGHEAFTATGATAGTSSVGAFDLKSILGLGWTMNDAENAGIKGAFDATAEIALASCRTRNACLPVDKGVTMEVDLVVSDKGDAAALDVDFGLGTALTTNSEADIDHADMAQLAGFHMDGNSDNILAQSDDNTTDVAAVDTTIDNDSTTGVAKKFKIVGRPDGTVEFWIAGARVLCSTSFALLNTAMVGAFVNVEKTSNDTTAEIILRNLRVAGGMAA